jgi:hypothetical protein
VEEYLVVYKRTVNPYSMPLPGQEEEMAHCETCSLFQNVFKIEVKTWPYPLLLRCKLYTHGRNVAAKCRSMYVSPYQLSVAIPIT